MCWWGWNSGEGEREKKTGGRRQQLPFLYIREHISVDLHSKNACLIKRRLMHGNASEITPWRAGGRHKPPIIPLLPLKKSNHSLHCGSTCTKCNWLYTLHVPQFSVNNADKALHRDKRTQQSVHPLFFRNKATAYSSQGDTSTASVRARHNAARKSRSGRGGKERREKQCVACIPATVSSVLPAEQSRAVGSAVVQICLVCSSQRPKPCYLVLLVVTLENVDQREGLRSLSRVKLETV